MGKSLQQQRIVRGIEARTIFKDDASLRGFETTSHNQNQLLLGVNNNLDIRRTDKSNMWKSLYRLPVRVSKLAQSGKLGHLERVNAQVLHG